MKLKFTLRYQKLMMYFGFEYLRHTQPDMDISIQKARKKQKYTLTQCMYIEDTVPCCVTAVTQIKLIINYLTQMKDYITF